MNDLESCQPTTRWVLEGRLGTYIPVEIVCGEKFTKIKTGGLLQEFGLGGMCRVVTERDQHRTGQIDDLGIKFEDFGGGLDLCFETMRGGSEPGNVSHHP